MKVLIDTCIILDALTSREPFRKDAEAIFLHAANNVFSGFITAKASTDIYYLLHRHTHSDRDSREVLGKLFSLFEVLDTAGMDCRRAIPSPMSDFEDAVMAETTLRSGIDCIVTRNTADFLKAQVLILSPAAFLQRLAEELK